LLDRQPTSEVHVHVMAPQPDAGAPAENRNEQGDAVGIEATRRAPRRAIDGRRDERLNFDQDRAAALERWGDDATRCGSVVLGEKCTGWVRDLAEALLPHLEHADFLGGSKAVLG